MPEYIFENGGCFIRRRYDADKVPDEIEAFGHTFVRFVREVELRPASIPAKWPMLSEGAAVNPKRVGQAREEIRKRGLRGVDVVPDGRIKLDSALARRQFNKAFGYFDKCGYD